MDLKQPASYATIADPVERTRAMSDDINLALEWIKHVAALREVAIVEAYKTVPNTKNLAASLGLSRSRVYEILNRHHYEPNVYDWSATVEKNKIIKERMEKMRRRYPMVSEEA